MPKAKELSQVNKIRDNRYLYIFLLVIIAVLLDQFTKILVVVSVPLYANIPVIDGFFNIVHIRNMGAAFGIFNDPNISWQFWLFMFATVVASVIVLNLTHKSPKDYLLFTGFGLILGGAYGNLVDRVRHRAVIDFLDFYINNWHWPAFNVADICICLGAFLTIISMLKQKN